MAIQTFKRYETKYIVTEEQKKQLIERINDYVEADRYCRDNKMYSILNIYYDSEDNDLIRVSTSKPVFKEKLRLRSYCENVSEEGMAFLEIKRKSKGIVTKRRVSLTLEQAQEFVLYGKKPTFDQYLNTQVVNEIDYFLKLHHVVPKVFIGYRRYALFAKEDKNIRITFDQDIQGRRDDLDLRSGYYGNPILNDGVYIMEIKGSLSLPLWLVQALNDLKIYPHGFSKYGKEYEQWIKGVDVI